MGSCTSPNSAPCSAITSSRIPWTADSNVFLALRRNLICSSIIATQAMLHLPEGTHPDETGSSAEYQYLGKDQRHPAPLGKGIWTVDTRRQPKKKPRSVRIR